GWPGHGRPSATPRYCCKSQKLVGDDFLAAGPFNRRPPICVASIGLPRSLASLSSGDEVPHIFTGESPLRPGEFLIISPKRLLQQYRPYSGHQSGRTPEPLRANSRPDQVQQTATTHHLGGADKHSGWHGKTCD